MHAGIGCLGREGHQAGIAQGLDQAAAGVADELPGQGEVARHRRQQFLRLGLLRVTHIAGKVVKADQELSLRRHAQLRPEGHARPSQVVCSQAAQSPPVRGEIAGPPTRACPAVRQLSKGGSAAVKMGLACFDNGSYNAVMTWDMKTRGLAPLAMGACFGRYHHGLCRKYRECPKIPILHALTAGALP